MAASFPGTTRQQVKYKSVGIYLSLTRLLGSVYPRNISGHNPCSEKHQFEHFEHLHLQLAVKDQAHVQETTGCFLPCTYTEYKVAAREKKDFGRFGLLLSYGWTRTTVLREFYIYDFPTLVSDFGGSLGLFVGFSFFMLWNFCKDSVSFVVGRLLCSNFLQ